MRTFLRTPRGVLAAAALICVPAFFSIHDVQAQKEFLVEGTVDCGRRSGARCDLGDLVSIWTADVTGTREKIAIDVSWVTKDLDRYDQDDKICLDVRVLPGGKLQAIGVAPRCGEPDPRPRPTEEDDDKPVAEALTPTSTPTSTSTPTPLTNLTVTKDDTDDPVAVGGSFSYTIMVRNTGTLSATGVVVRDLISREPGTSANLLFTTDPSAQPGGFTCAVTGGSVDTAELTCTGGTIAAGGSITITFDFVAISAGVITNTATVDPDDTFDESNEGDNTDTETTTFTATDGAAPAGRSSEPGRRLLEGPRP